MNVSTIPAVPGSRHRRKRVGRGIGSGHGKTATRGQKGQRARSGSGKRPGFEGGRTPLIRQMPKRGLRYKASGRSIPVEIINVHQLNRCRDGERVTLDRLAELGLIDDRSHRVKLLGEGSLTKRLSVTVHQASESAKSKVEQAGGSIEFLDRPPTAPGAESAPGP
ncbi:MAG: 50S ribosomal protein L15 [Candidatus Omnitrophica bacterium]|nr:50S ribosomal protein L15 [Candidatus Omnitrophota bacterium]